MISMSSEGVVRGVPVTFLLTDHILTRLTSTGAGADQHPWSLLILTTLDGPQALAGYLGGSRAINPPAKPRGKAQTKSADTPVTEPPGVYLDAITVSGFRGIGRRGAAGRGRRTAGGHAHVERGRRMGAGVVAAVESEGGLSF